MKYKLYSEYGLLNTEDEIIEAFKSIWEQIDIAMIERFCKHYDNRLKAVIEKNGLQTEY